MPTRQQGNAKIAKMPP